MRQHGSLFNFSLRICAFVVSNMWVDLQQFAFNLHPFISIYSIITIQSTNECTGPMNSRTLLLRLLPFNLKRTRSLTSAAGRKGKEVDRVQKPPQAGRLCLPRSRWKSSARTTRRLTTGYMRSSSLSRSMRNLRRSFRLFPPCAFLLRANAQRSLRSVHTAIKTIDNC